MAEYIPRETAKEELLSWARCINHPEHLMTEDAMCILDNIPAAKVVPIRGGKWILHKDGSGTCDQCHRNQSEVWDMDTWQNFCGHCGADMRGE